MIKKLVVSFCKLSIVASVLLPYQIFAKELIFTAPPRESVEAGQKMYAPLTKHLTKVLGQKVTYIHPDNWMTYIRDMRNDKYDIVFDGPHFTSWRMANLGHEALIKLPGKLQFILIGNLGDEKLRSADDLIGKKICGISPPHLSTLSVLDYYRNPVRQPVIKGIKGGMGKVVKAFVAGECRAAVLRTVYYNKKLAKEKRQETKHIFTSKALPGQAISVSTRVDSKAKQKIKETLTRGEGVAYTKSILKRFAKKSKSFVTVSKNEYQGHNLLLEGVIFGW